MTAKLCIGIPAYGTQPPDWWNPLVSEAARLYTDGIELIATIAIGSMKTDSNRNAICEEFEKLHKSDQAEWLFWLDADNTIPVGAIKRLLSVGRTLITGVYVKRGDEPTPIIYYKNPDGLYEDVENWNRGEILPIDSAGMGGCLMHVSVLQDMKKNYRILERASGGIVTVHKDDIYGDIFDTTEDSDGHVIDGVLWDRLRIPKHKHRFPFCMMEYGRTEDYDFFEKAARAGHKLWVDTSVELGHIGSKTSKVADWRKYKRELIHESISNRIG